MRILFLSIIIFFQAASIGIASTYFTENVESIDLKLKDKEVAVTFFGLSDGEATLIQGSKGENILVNAGGKDTAGELKEMLKLYGVKEIAALIITTPQSLFAEQINQMITTYKIKELITTPELSLRLTKIIDPASQIEMKTWEEGTTKPLFPDMTADVLFAGKDHNEGLDLTLQFLNHRLFLMTSFSQRSEETLLKKNLNDVTIFKVPNWAKEDSLSEKLIQYVNPEISMVFKSVEHQPDPEIINDIQDTWSEVYFTEKHGTVTIKFTEKNYEVFTIGNETKD